MGLPPEKKNLLHTQRGGAEPLPYEKDGEGVSVSAMAQEVLDGKWGNGEERKQKLGAWFYDLVQGEVNRMLGV